MNKNDKIVIKIEDIGVDGEGIGKIDGYTWFVKNALIGDTVEAVVTKMKKHYGYAKMLNIIEPSKDRVEPKCPVARQCGGCQIQELSYEAQLRFKTKKVRGNLERIGGFAPEFLDAVMEPICGMYTTGGEYLRSDCKAGRAESLLGAGKVRDGWEGFRYRNKAQFPIGTDKNGQIVTGFYAGRTHQIIPNMECALGAEINQDILRIIVDFMNENHISAYDETTGRGLVRHVLIRCGFKTGEIMVCLVINGDKFPKSEELVDKLVQIEGMTSITYSKNRENTNVIMGKEIGVLWGQGYITDYIGNVKYQISPLSFFQVNPVQTEKLYGLALEYADLTGKETVWDLYCGIGTISLFLARNAKQVYGVEIVPQAIDDARNNAKINDIKNAEFFVGKAEEVLPEYYARYESVCGNPTSVRTEWCQEIGRTSDDEMMTPDVIVVDPPRKGCDEALLKTMVQMSPERIVYVSCDSATLARDLKYLCENGYEVKRARAIDLFPMTVHCETVVLLSRQKYRDEYEEYFMNRTVEDIMLEYGEQRDEWKVCRPKKVTDETVCLLSKLNAKQHVEVELNMDELDLTAAESKATYQEIKDYIFEKHGVKVSSLYIAQVKEKHGIIERENYNIRKATRRMDSLLDNSTTATNLENADSQGKVKAEDAKQLKCPVEKERLIEEALREFKMI